MLEVNWNAYNVKVSKNPTENSTAKPSKLRLTLLRHLSDPNAKEWNAKSPEELALFALRGSTKSFEPTKETINNALRLLSYSGYTQSTKHSKVALAGAIAAHLEYVEKIGTAILWRPDLEASSASITDGMMEYCRDADGNSILHTMIRAGNLAYIHPNLLSKKLLLRKNNLGLSPLEILLSGPNHQLQYLPNEFRNTQVFLNSGTRNETYLNKAVAQLKYLPELSGAKELLEAKHGRNGIPPIFLAAKAGTFKHIDPRLLTEDTLLLRSPTGDTLMHTVLLHSPSVLANIPTSALTQKVLEARNTKGITPIELIIGKGNRYTEHHGIEYITPDILKECLTREFLQGTIISTNTAEKTSRLHELAKHNSLPVVPAGVISPEDMLIEDQLGKTVLYTCLQGSNPIPKDLLLASHFNRPEHLYAAIKCGVINLKELISDNNETESLLLNGHLSPDIPPSIREEMNRELSGKTLLEYAVIRNQAHTIHGGIIANNLQMQCRSYFDVERQRTNFADFNGPRSSFVENDPRSGITLLDLICCYGSFEAIPAKALTREILNTPDSLGLTPLQRSSFWDHFEKLDHVMDNINAEDLLSRHNGISPIELFFINPNRLNTTEEKVKAQIVPDAEIKERIQQEFAKAVKSNSTNIGIWRLLLTRDLPDKLISKLPEDLLSVRQALAYTPVHSESDTIEVDI